MTSPFHFDPYRPRYTTISPPRVSHHSQESATGGSRLSGVGSQLFDQRTVQHKQTQQFDILSNKPLQWNPAIKQHPKLTL